MNSNELKIYCVTNKKVNFISKPEYKLSWVGNDEIPVKPPNATVETHFLLMIQLIHL